MTSLNGAKRTASAFEPAPRSLVLFVYFLLGCEFLLFVLLIAEFSSPGLGSRVGNFPLFGIPVSAFFATAFGLNLLSRTRNRAWAIVPAVALGALLLFFVLFTLMLGTGG